MNDKLVWIDCEMTGLSLEHDALVEVAALVTDYELNVLGDGVDLVIKPPAAALEQMNDVVTRMHTSSGLLDELDAGLTLQRGRGAGARLRPRVRARAAQGAARRQHGRHRPRVPGPRHARARGLDALPRHRRLLDQGAHPQWYPRAYFAAPAKAGNHRALADINESIDELRYYRKAVFVPPPGPDTETARALAAEVPKTRGEQPGES